MSLRIEDDWICRWCSDAQLTLITFWIQMLMYWLLCQLAICFERCQSRCQTYMMLGVASSRSGEGGNAIRKSHSLLHISIVRATSSTVKNWLWNVKNIDNLTSVDNISISEKINALLWTNWCRQVLQPLFFIIYQSPGLSFIKTLRWKICLTSSWHVIIL